MICLSELKSFCVKIISDVGYLGKSNVNRHWSMGARSTSVVASAVPVVWPGMVSVGVMLASAMVSARIRLWSGPTASVSAFMTVVEGWPIVRSMLGWWSVAMCRCAWGSYSVWTVYWYVSIFVTLKTSYIWIMSCYVSCFLALETVIFLIRHNIYCWGWYQCSCKLLSSLEFLNFRYGICESLQSLFIYSSG